MWQRPDSPSDLADRSSMYLCRWPNGSFSIVSARNFKHALQQLDEVGNAEGDGANISLLNDCLLDFTLEDNGDFSLAQIGERTEREIRGRCYPILEELESDSADDILAAVQKERERLRKKRRHGEPHTEFGREIQARTDIAREHDRGTRR
jgi:hypothetical protein